MSGDRVANRFGRCFLHRKESFDLKNLKQADHIVEEKYSTYWHHMIVENIDLNKKQINVIHYYNKEGPSGSGSRVCRDSFPYTKDKFCRIVYEDEECLPAPEVLKKAGARVGEKEPTYCLFTNNCEHFANECKTGKKECYQKQTANEILGKSVVTSSIGSLVNVAKNFMSSVYKKIISVCPGLKKLTEEYIAKFNPELAFSISAATEVILLLHDCYIASTKFSEEKLTRKEFLGVVTTRICAAVRSLSVGFQFRYLFGGVTSLVFPGWCRLLCVLAEIVVGAGCDYLTKVAGYYLGEITTPLALVTSWVLYNEKYLGLYAEKFLDNDIVKYLVLYIVKYLSGGKITMDGLQSEKMNNYLPSLDRACDLMRQGKMYTYTSFVPAMYKQYCSTDFNNICRFADMSKMLDIDTFLERLTQTSLLAAWNF